MNCLPILLQILTFKLLETLKPLLLLHVSKQPQRQHPQKRKEAHKSPNAVNAVGKNNGSTGVLFEKTEQVKVFVFNCVENKPCLC